MEKKGKRNGKRLQHYYEISFRFSRNACTRACVDRFLGIIPEMSRRNDAKHPSLIPLEDRKTLSLSLYSTEREEIVSSRLLACVRRSILLHRGYFGKFGETEGDPPVVYSFPDRRLR